jgi:alkanesulfonate monooxygenase SsuD/methylene tetrahydromethanopterin reductase-like flavin-dependent oxidoreductase (luciferase family)
MRESRSRFEEAWEIVRRAWTEEVFSYEGEFWSYKDVAIWPRPVQQPHPPVWVPVSSSKESIEWAAAHNIPITPGLGSRGLQEDVIRYYSECLERHGHRLTPDHLIITTNAYVADSKAEALKEAGPYTLYFNQTLFSHGNITEANLQEQAGYLSSDSHSYVRPENRAAVARAREDYRGLTMESLERQVQTQPWGPADEVRDRILEAAEHAGANTVLVSLNRGAMPHDQFMEQIRRFGREVLPALQAHEIGAARVG